MSPKTFVASSKPIDGIESGWRAISVSVRTRLPAARALSNMRWSTERVAPASRARRSAVRTWPSTSLSPSAIESRPAATWNRCRAASAPSR